MNLRGTVGVRQVVPQGTEMLLLVRYIPHSLSYFPWGRLLKPRTNLTQGVREIIFNASCYKFYHDDTDSSYIDALIRLVDAVLV